MKLTISSHDSRKDYWNRQYDGYILVARRHLVRCPSSMDILVFHIIILFWQVTWDRGWHVKPATIEARWLAIDFCFVKNRGDFIKSIQAHGIGSKKSDEIRVFCRKLPSGILRFVLKAIESGLLHGPRIFLNTVI